MTKEQMEQIVLANMQKIYLYCVRRLGNTADAEDVSSDIIYELLGSYERIKDDKAILGYIWAVADNLCKNYWRKSMKFEIVEIPEKYVGTFQITAEEELICEENMSLMRRELALLSNTYREIMVRHYIHGEGCGQISQSMNISVQNVKQYLFEGRKKVKKGMDTQRKYGVYSYAPEKFSINYFGDCSNGYWELFERKLPGSIMLSVWNNPKTMEELSMDVGVAVPYLEEEVEKLENFKLLIKKGKKYHSGIVIFDKDYVCEIRRRAGESIANNIESVKAAVEKGKSFLNDTDYNCYLDDKNVRGWFILILILWEAIQKSEEKMKTFLSFPLQANGYKGYVMGCRGEYPLAMNGMYGMYSLEKGYLRAINYKVLSNKVINPFERGAREVFLACEGRLSETTELETLSDMMSDKIVHIEEGKICPNFVEISERCYKEIMDKLALEINEMAELAASIRDGAADLLENHVPKGYSEAREIGSIVSMWSMLEEAASAVIEAGYLSEGSAEQNVTTFYIRR